MPKVAIPSLLRNLTAGEEHVLVEGTTVREVIDNLEKAYPGLKDRLCDGDQISRNFAVCVNGIVSRKRMRQSVEENAEIHFIPPIAGGTAHVPTAAYDTGFHSINNGVVKRENRRISVDV